MRFAFSSPVRPVQAFALPAFAMIARTSLAFLNVMMPENEM